MISPNLESEGQKQSTIPGPTDFKGPTAFVAGFFGVHDRFYIHMVPTLPLKPHLSGPVQLLTYILNWTGEFRELRNL